MFVGSNVLGDPLVLWSDRSKNGKKGKSRQACRLLTSATYHLVRKWHGLPELPYLGQELAYIRDDPNLACI